MTRTIDDLLAHAALPAPPCAAFDIGAALRRLAAAAARAAPPPDLARSAQAGQRLAVVSRWVLNRTGSALRLQRLAEDPGRQGARLLDEEALDVEGALVYACLLYLTGHRESAQFWWQLAAGAGSRAAAYCLHLHHLHLGEAKEARHWYHQLTDSTTADSTPPDDAFIEGLEAVARYVRRHKSDAPPPTGRLEDEIDRLASGSSGSACLIVRRPDRRLADQLHEFLSRQSQPPTATEHRNP